MNLNGIVMPVRGYHVGEWTPERDGKGKTTQVHLLLEIGHEGPPIVLRLKSRKACETLISALQTHMDGVWPKGEE